jgi:hypothetical protein
MKRILLLCAVLLSAFLCHAQFKEKLTAEASVSFPVEAEKGSSDNNNYWVAQTMKDSLAIRLMAMVLDGSKYNLDAKTIAANYDKPEFIDAIVKGMLENRKSINVVSRTKINRGIVKGYDLYMENTLPDDDYPYSKIYTQFFFSGTTIYMLGVYVLEDTDATEEKEQFFNSFSIR